MPKAVRMLKKRKAWFKDWQKYIRATDVPAITHPKERIVLAASRSLIQPQKRAEKA